MNEITIADIKKLENDCAEKSKELKTSIAALQSKANGEEPMSMEDMEEMCSSLAKYIDYVDQRVNRAFEAVWKCDDKMYSHAGSKHLPPLSPSQMNKLLQKTGLDGDFVVMPATIYASTASKNQKTIEIEWLPK